MKRLILASQSLGRKKVLEDAGFVFDVIPSDFEEDMSISIPPHELAVSLSLGKARSVAASVTDAIVIGADTFGVYRGALLGKPHTKENAKKMLSMLSGDIHLMVTGLSVIDTSVGVEKTASIETKIWFKKISEQEIDEYIATGESLSKAGGYAYQGLGRKFVEKVEGSETNILGLPVDELMEMLQSLGYKK